MTFQEEHESRQQAFAEKLAEAIKNGGCPKCAAYVGVKHEDPVDGKTYRQCHYCGFRYDITELMKKQEQITNG